MRRCCFVCLGVVFVSFDWCLAVCVATGCLFGVWAFAAGDFWLLC